jgi:sugar phosphate isomerase/epimerase
LYADGTGMKLGVVSSALLGFEFAEALGHLERLGVQSVELGSGGYHVPKFCPVDVLLSDTDARARWLDGFAQHGLEISAFAVHGDALSPDPAIASEYDRQFRQTCELAASIGVTRLTLLAGLPEGAPGDSAQCWVVARFPEFNGHILHWQWKERVLPYWREHAAIAEAHGCRLCFEMHPSDVVYNPATLLQLREEIGPVVGCNLDPSHLFWQGIDPVEVTSLLRDLIYHVHAKDTRVVARNVRVNGVIEATPGRPLGERAWVFRTVGYGHPEAFWRDFVTALRDAGYDDVISIEHEDEYLDSAEGLEKACRFLQPILFEREAAPPWWEQ